MPPPRIIVQPMDVTRPITQNAMFTCVGEGYGFVIVSWLRGSKKLEEKSIVTTTVTPDNITSILTIPDLEDADGRRYRCIYNNSGGPTRSDRARLAIGSKCL